MKIYITRHGFTELNKKGLINGSIDDTLTPEGEQQAREVSLLLPSTIKHIYSSPLERAKQTSKIINEKLNVDLTFHHELKEVNFGILEGTPFLDEYKERHKMVDYDWRPSGECVLDVKLRTIKILKEIREHNKDGEVLIVAHGGTIRMLNTLESNEIMGEIGNASLYTFDLDKILEKTENNI